MRSWRKKGRRVTYVVHGSAMSLAARAGYRIPDEFVSVIPHVHDAPPGDCSCDIADRANGYQP